MIWAQTAGGVPSVDSSLWTQFGPFAICFILMAGIIWWLLKDRSQVRAELSRERREHEATRQQINRDVIPLVTRMVDLLKDMREERHAAPGRG